LHLNNGATDRPDFIFETDRFLVDQMIDVGADAKPVLVDVNADGLLDLLVGNQWLYSRDNNEDARIFYYENVGTASAPSFQLADEDWMRLSQFNNTTFDFAPAFGDLDADGDLDMIIGDDKGKLFFSENEGGTTGAMVFNNFVYAYMDIDVGKAARPQIIDLNGDGLLDLVLGERGGNNNVDGSGVCGTLNYYQNVGTINAPQFNTVDGGKPDLAPNTSCLGQVLTIPPNGVLSYSDPVFWDYGDRRELFVGTEFGDVIRYNNITTNPNDVYQIESANVLSTYVGARISPALADINGDKKLDMVVGNARGGLSFFTSDIEVETPASATDLSEDLQLSIFPNPAASSFEIRLYDESIANYRCQVEVFGVDGQLMYRAAMTNPWTRIESKDWSPGLYMVKVSSREQQSYRKIIIQ
ncbi:MAG: T9SS type A sorting domain-containing protein, partial [Bacteroidota bacterium]